MIGGSLDCFTTTSMFYKYDTEQAHGIWLGRSKYSRVFYRLAPFAGRATSLSNSTKSLDILEWQRQLYIYCVLALFFNKCLSSGRFNSSLFLYYATASELHNVGPWQGFGFLFTAPQRYLLSMSCSRKARASNQSSILRHLSIVFDSYLLEGYEPLASSSFLPRPFAYGNCNYFGFLQ